MTRHEDDDFEVVLLVHECSCGHTMSAKIVGRATADDIDATWRDDHPFGGYVGGSFHGDMPK